MQTAVVTGASSGIGAATARELAGRGWHVILVARRLAELELLAKEIGNHATVEACDASDGPSVLALAARTVERFGAPNAIVHAAGIGRWDFIENTTPAQAVEMMGAPFFCAFHVTHAFMRSMIGARRGIIVHVNSPAALFPWPGCTGYTATRWALRGLHEALSQDLAGTGVKSCHVVFGRVATSILEHDPGAEEKIPGIAHTIRTMQPEECGRIIANAISRPRHQIIEPLLLRFYYWNAMVAPWLIRALLRWTGARHGATAQK